MQDAGFNGKVENTWGDQPPLPPVGGGVARTTHPSFSPIYLKHEFCSLLRPLCRPLVLGTDQHFPPPPNLCPLGGPRDRGRGHKKGRIYLSAKFLCLSNLVKGFGDSLRSIQKWNFWQFPITFSNRQKCWRKIQPCATTLLRHHW